MPEPNRFVWQRGDIKTPKDEMERGSTPKAEARYQTMPNGDERCEGCTMFRPPDGCITVKGTIAPYGWCKYFEEEDDDDDYEKAEPKPKDGQPKTLYAWRDVLNAQQIIDWAKQQGFETTVPDDEMHTTIAYSKEPVDWSKMGEAPKALTVNGGSRMVQALGDGGAVVLRFEAPALRERHDTMRERGASWEYYGFKPHVTISWQAPEDLDLDEVEPYTGPIELGPERFDEVKDDWKDNMMEKALSELHKSSYDVVKVDKKLGLVFGWAVISKIDGKDYYDRNVDSDGERVPEHIPEQSMLEAASDFMENSRIGKDMHSGEAAGQVVFAFPLTTDIAKAMGISTRVTGLMVAMKPNKELLGKFESGALKGFSIGGSRLKCEDVEVES